MRFYAGGNRSGRSHRDNFAAARPAFRTQIDDPIRRADDIEIVFDDQQAAAVFDDAFEGCQELGDVVEMQTRGGLVADVECSA